jgi:hypothetical protein
MRAWPLHVAFATILVGSLAAKERAADLLVDVDDVARETAVMRVARSHGLTFRDYGALPGSGASLRALAFEAPGCSLPVLVVLRVSFDEEPLLHSTREHGDVLRYVYIGRSWEKPDRLAFFVERMKYAALATFSLTRYVPSGHLLLVESPWQCQAADAIDWRSVWNRDYVGAARAGPGATTR